MRVTDKDIIRIAQQLRDEDNQQQHVIPWQHHRHFQLPAWLVAVPAAAIIGFFFGLWANGNIDKKEPLAAMTDTVYIKIKEPDVTTDTTIRLVPQQVPVATKSPKVVRPRRTRSGRPLSEDKIRYDLLVKN